MVKRVKRKNLVFGFMLLTGLLGAIHEGRQYLQIERINQAILAGRMITDEDYPELQKYSAAYDQGERQDYKHAVQTWGQLLETTGSPGEQARIQYNIGNSLFQSGLIRRVNDDGSLQDEARYAFSQARLAYEQSLRLQPASRRARFNLSLLYAVMPQNMHAGQKDQSGMELSNLPIGLP